MIVKSFIADTVAGALKQARNELGGDAVILKTRKLDGLHPSAGGGRVEVTACVDKAAAAPVPASTPAPQPGKARPTAAVVHEPASVHAADIVQKLDFLIDIFQAPLRRNAFAGNISRLFSALLQADVPEPTAYEITDKIADRFTPGDPYKDISAAAIDLLCHQLPAPRLSQGFQAGQRLVLVGPGGGGKTSLMGRLAGHLLHHERIGVCLTSFDRVKVAASEELATYADILNVEHLALSRQSDSSLIESQGKDKITLIDTPALNPRDRVEINAFAEKLSSLRPERIIGVFPATIRSGDLFDMLRALRPLGLTDLAVTMTDQTCRLGAMIALSIQSGLPLSILGTGRGATAIVLAPDCRSIIQGFLGSEEGENDD